jgi:hypothetical protein
MLPPYSAFNTEDERSMFLRLNIKLSKALWEEDFKILTYPTPVFAKLLAAKHFTSNIYEQYERLSRQRFNKTVTFAYHDTARRETSKNAEKIT